MRDELEKVERQRNDAMAKVLKLTEENQRLKEELRHYQMAVSAVKWLADQANLQQAFQL